MTWQAPEPGRPVVRTCVGTLPSGLACGKRFKDHPPSKGETPGPVEYCPTCLGRVEEALRALRETPSAGVGREPQTRGGGRHRKLVGETVWRGTHRLSWNDGRRRA